MPGSGDRWEDSRYGAPLGSPVEVMTRSEGGYQLVQPYGLRIGEWTVLGTYDTAADAFAVLDLKTALMLFRGAPSDAIQVLVVDADGKHVPRPGAH